MVARTAEPEVRCTINVAVCPKHVGFVTVTGYDVQLKGFLIDKNPPKKADK